MLTTRWAAKAAGKEGGAPTRAGRSKSGAGAGGVGESSGAFAVSGSCGGGQLEGTAKASAGVEVLKPANDVEVDTQSGLSTRSECGAPLKLTEYSTPSESPTSTPLQTRTGSPLIGLLPLTCSTMKPRYVMGERGGTSD